LDRVFWIPKYFRQKLMHGSRLRIKIV
jgi:hypothetical protein